MVARFYYAIVFVGRGLAPAVRGSGMRAINDRPYGWLRRRARVMDAENNGSLREGAPDGVGWRSLRQRFVNKSRIAAGDKPPPYGWLRSSLLCLFARCLQLLAVYGGGNAHLLLKGVAKIGG